MKPTLLMLISAVVKVGGLRGAGPERREGGHRRERYAGPPGLIYQCVFHVLTPR